MQIPFIKYQGTGNDFVIIDNRQMLYQNLDVAFLCHPKFGIGGDGLMLLQNLDGYAFEMVYYNSDGKQSSMCGNGGRCLVDFAKRLGVFEGENCLFKAIDGPHQAKWSESSVELQMQDVLNIDKRNSDYVLNTGSPHYVSVHKDIRGMDLLSEAKAIRYNDEFKASGINVNFIEILGPNRIKVRTYERGVENETLSCGTGVTASALVLAKHLNFEPGNHSIDIETPGGNLSVKFTLGESFTNVWLCGPATKVFEGLIMV